MPLTQLTVTGGAHGWVGPDNTPARGTVILQPVQEVSGGGYIVVRSAVIFPLVNGNINGSIASNAEAASLQYLVTEQIQGVQNPIPYVVVPSGATLDLSIAARGSGPAFPLYVLLAAVGAVNGVAPLDGTAKIPLAYLPSGSGVLSVTAGDGTVTIGGTASAPTVAVNVITEAQVAGLPADLTTLSAGIAGAVTSVNALNTAKAPRPVIRQAWIKTGDANPLPSTGGLWKALAGYELVIPAVAGDYIDVALNAMRRDPSGNSWLDVAVATGVDPTTTLVRFLASGDATPGTEGDPAWYVPQVGIVGRGSGRGFTVEAGDLVAGNVHLRIAVKSNGTGILYSSTDYPMYWRATNLGQVN